MSSHLLDDGALVLCAHGGRATSSRPSGRVRAGGRAITTSDSPHVVTGCPHTVSGSPAPCIEAQWTGGASRVRSLGVPVLLEDGSAVCTPHGTAVSVVATQVRVRGA